VLYDRRGSIWLTPLFNQSFLRVDRYSGEGEEVLPHWWQPEGGGCGAPRENPLYAFPLLLDDTIWLPPLGWQTFVTLHLGTREGTRLTWKPEESVLTSEVPTGHSGIIRPAFCYPACQWHFATRRANGILLPSVPMAFCYPEF
jgi:hypothetical protein